MSYVRHCPTFVPRTPHRAFRTGPPARPSVVLAALVFGAVVTCGRPALAQTVDPEMYVADAPVQAVLPLGNAVYIAGSFTQVGPATGCWVPLDATTGLPTAVNSDGLPVGPYPRVAGVVNAAVPDGLGGWYIGGSFTSVGGVARANIAHIRADNSVDAWGPNPNNGVNCLAMNGSSLVVGGVFSTIGG